MKVGVIFNGSKSKKKLNDYIQSLEKDNYQIQVFETKNVEDISIQTRNAVESGCDLLVSAGGDGTLLYIVNIVVDFPDIAIVTLPLGTGNDFSKMLGIYNIVDAVKATKQYSVCKVDIIETKFCNLALKSQKLYFCSSAGIGIFANLFRQENFMSIKILRKLLGNLMNYISTIVSIFVTKQFDCEIKFNDKVHSFSLKLLEINKVRECGGAVFTPKANINNAIMDIWTINDAHVGNLLLIVIKNIFGKHLQDKHVDYFSDCDSDNRFAIYNVKNLSLKISEQTPFHLHGEFIGHNPEHFQLIPQKLKFLSNDKV